MSDSIPLPMCASCKFGLCIQQVMPMENTTVIAPQREPEPWEEQDEDETESTFVPSITAYSAICWWHPSEEKLRHPIEVMHVKKCSRYQLRDELKEEQQDDDTVSEEG